MSNIFYASRSLTLTIQFSSRCRFTSFWLCRPSPVGFQDWSKYVFEKKRKKNIPKTDWFVQAKAENTEHGKCNGFLQMIYSKGKWPKILNDSLTSPTLVPACRDAHEEEKAANDADWQSTSSGPWHYTMHTADSIWQDPRPGSREMPRFRTSWLHYFEDPGKPDAASRLLVTD